LDLNVYFWEAKHPHATWDHWNVLPFPILFSLFTFTCHLVFFSMDFLAPLKPIVTTKHLFLISWNSLTWLCKNDHLFKGFFWVLLIPTSPSLFYLLPFQTCIHIKTLEVLCLQTFKTLLNSHQKHFVFSCTWTFVVRFNI